MTPKNFLLKTKHQIQKKMGEYVKLKEIDAKIKGFSATVEGYERPEGYTFSNKEEFKFALLQDRLKSLIANTDSYVTLRKGLKHILIPVDDNGRKKSERSIHMEEWFEKVFDNPMGHLLATVLMMGLFAIYYLNVVTLLLAKKYSIDYTWVNDHYDGLFIWTVIFSIVMGGMLCASGIGDTGRMYNINAFVKLSYVLLFIAIAALPPLIVTFV